MLEELGEEGGVDILMAREVDFAAQEGHDVPVEANLDGIGVKQISLSAPET